MKKFASGIFAVLMAVFIMGTNYVTPALALGSAPPQLSKDATNLSDAYDNKDWTTANILTASGYIIYKLKDLGLTPETGSSYLIGTSKGKKYSVALNYLDKNFNVIDTAALNITGAKCEVDVAIPTGAVYVKINGISGSKGVMLYIYEIEANKASVPISNASAQLSKDATNLPDAYDKKDWTTANILTPSGYIIYKLKDLGLSPATGSCYLIGASNGKKYSVALNYLDKNFNVIDTATLNITGAKCEVDAAIPAGAVYVKINGISGAMLYICEIEADGASASTPTTQLSKDATNLPDAYDKKDWTTANILTAKGYIIYKLKDLGLTQSTGSSYLIGASKGKKHSVALNYLDKNFNVIDTATLDITGTKCQVDAPIPAGAVYVKINGISGAMLYIYEIEANKASSPMSNASVQLSKDATNLPDAYDKKDWTTANILTAKGYIIYKLKDLGLTPATGSSYLIGASNGKKHSVALNYLDKNYNVIDTATLNITGAKCEVDAAIPTGAVYVKINGVSGAMLYIYEIA